MYTVCKHADMSPNNCNKLTIILPLWNTSHILSYHKKELELLLIAYLQLTISTLTRGCLIVWEYLWETWCCWVAGESGGIKNNLQVQFEHRSSRMCV